MPDKQEKQWFVDMTAEAVIPPWTHTGHSGQNGSELQRAIVKGFSEDGKDPIWGANTPLNFEKTFTFKEHGEFFRGALTMASLRYTNDFYELLKRYGTIRVTITKELREER